MNICKKETKENVLKIELFIALFCSKKRKKKGKVFKQFYEELYTQRDDSSEWDSQDSADHKNWPKDPLAVITRYPPKKKSK